MFRRFNLHLNNTNSISNNNQKLTYFHISLLSLFIISCVGQYLFNVRLIEEQKLQLNNNLDKLDNFHIDSDSTSTEKYKHYNEENNIIARQQQPSSSINTNTLSFATVPEEQDKKGLTSPPSNKDPQYNDNDSLKVKLTAARDLRIQSGIESKFGDKDGESSVFENEIKNNEPKLEIGTKYNQIENLGNPTNTYSIPQIKVFLRGRLGNNLFQLAWALYISDITEYRISIIPYKNIPVKQHEKEFENTLFDDKIFHCFPYLINNVDRSTSYSFQDEKNFTTAQVSSIEVIGDHKWIQHFEQHFDKNHHFYKDKDIIIKGYMQRIDGVNDIQNIRNWFSLHKRCTFQNQNIIPHHDITLLKNREEEAPLQAQKNSLILEQKQNNQIVNKNDIVIHIRDYQSEFISQSLTDQKLIERLKSKFLDLNTEYYHHVLNESIKYNPKEQRIWIITPPISSSCISCVSNPTIQYLQKEYNAIVFDPVLHHKRQEINVAAFDEIDRHREDENFPVNSMSNEILSFSFLMNFETVVIAHSTFSWWAAYLSTKAINIHYPALPPYSTSHRILPPPREEDNRYRVHYIY